MKTVAKSGGVLRRNVLPSRLVDSRIEYRNRCFVWIRNSSVALVSSFVYSSVTFVCPVMAAIVGRTLEGDFCICIYFYFALEVFFFPGTTVL